MDLDVYTPTDDIPQAAYLADSWHGDQSTQQEDIQVTEAPPQHNNDTQRYDDLHPLDQEDVRRLNHLRATMAALTDVTEYHQALRNYNAIAHKLRRRTRRRRLRARLLAAPGSLPPLPRTRRPVQTPPLRDMVVHWTQHFTKHDTDYPWADAVFGPGALTPPDPVSLREALHHGGHPRPPSKGCWP